MTFQPNTETATKRFIDRIASAYFQTWAGFGFSGPEYTFDEAMKIAEGMAEHCFPRPVVSVVVDVPIDDEQLRMMLLRPGPNVILESLPMKAGVEHRYEPAYTLPAHSFGPDAPCGDDVVGD